MVTFVPPFVSRESASWYARRDSARALATTRFPSDTAARTRENTAWETANPAPASTLAQVADHIEHVRKVAGVDHVGIGSDFDGIDATPVGLEDVSKFPFLFAELARRGWSDGELRKLAGENVLRVLTRAEEVAARLQHERRPSTKTIAELDGRRAN
jgi:membrane dipeptidase